MTATLQTFASANSTQITTVVYCYIKFIVCHNYVMLVNCIITLYRASPPIAQKGIYNHYHALQQLLHTSV